MGNENLNLTEVESKSSFNNCIKMLIEDDRYPTIGTYVFRNNESNKKVVIANLKNTFQDK